MAITGIGLITPAGASAGETWQRVVEGKHTAAPDEALHGMPVALTCRAADFDGDAVLGRRTAWRLDRCTQLALAAGREAVADAGLAPEDWDSTRVGTVLGTAFGGVATWEREYLKLHERGPERVSPLTVPMSLTNMVAGQLAMDRGARGPSLVTSTACASGATAIGTAHQLLRSGGCDVVLAGGSESSLVPSVVAGFTKAGALSRQTEDPARASRPFDAERDGFVIGEAAAVLVLERAEHAAARGAHVYAYLSGYGASADAGHETRPDPEGRGAEQAVRGALSDAGLAPADITHVNAHGTSTPLNDASEARMIQRVFPTGPAVTSVKGVTGHSLGAAGAVEAAIAALSLEHQTLPVTAGLTRLDPDMDLDVVAGVSRCGSVDAVLSESFGFGGQNAALILTRA
ncbi:3-oxoacyl-ACP synthase [Streptomyces albus]|nr:3-oxoacyl-ACP synthase [Streptomyces albus]